MKDQLRESSPTQDLRAYLLGSWTVERSLWDRAGGARGTFTGVVRYSETPDGGLLLREDGTMTWPTHKGPAFREYLLRPSDSPEAMDVYFPDGKPFHRMSFRDHANEDSHWCDPDDYRVNYLWGGQDAFSYAWDVHGPAKDLLLESRLRREL